MLKFVPDRGIGLRAVTKDDCEHLRTWKNANRFSFFFQDLITPQQQSEWFEKYVSRSDDYMFIATRGALPLGCMGFRMLSGKADVYNVILGRAEMGGKGWMGQALQLMCSFIRSRHTGEVALKVLRGNPAVAWYRANGFVETAAREDHFELTLDLGGFQAQAFERVDFSTGGRR